MKGAPNDIFIVMEPFLMFFLGVFSKFGVYILLRALKMAKQKPFESVVPFSKDDTHKSRSVVTCRTGMQHGRPFIAWPLHKDF
jgi:hypothetical protein